MPWVWGTIAGYSGPYHLVWSRDLYQIATALLAAGDRAAAGARSTTCWTASRSPTAASRRTRTSTARRTGRTCSSTRSPTRSCSPGSSAAATPRTWRARQARGRLHPRQRAAYHAGALGEPRRLLARDDRRRDRRARLRRRDRRAQRRRRARGSTYRAIADEWQAERRRLDRDDQRPAAPRSPYYLRLTVDGNPNAGTTYTIGDGGPTVDQRTVVDPSFLELVRLGVKPADAPARAATRCRSSTASSASTRRTAGSGTATTTTATARSGRPNWDSACPATRPRTGRTTRSAACGRSSPASAASTSCWPATRRAARGAARARSPTPPTAASCSPSRCGTTTRRPAPGFPRRHGDASGDAARRGRTRSSCGSRGRSTRAARSSGPAVRRLPLRRAVG